MKYSGTVSSTDLGGSSKYSNKIFEGRGGEGFHVNSNWTWVTRSLEKGKFLKNRFENINWCIFERAEVYYYFREISKWQHLRVGDIGIIVWKRFLFFSLI